jgi:hypothetical protein
MKKLVLSIMLMMLLSCSGYNHLAELKLAKTKTPYSLESNPDMSVCAKLYLIDYTGQNPFKINSRIESIDNKTVNRNFPGVIILPPGDHSIIMVIEKDKYVTDYTTNPDSYGRYKEAYHFESLPSEIKKLSYSFKGSTSYFIDENGKINKQPNQTLASLAYVGIGIGLLILCISSTL